MNVIAGGRQNGSGTVTIGKSTDLLKVMADGADAVIVLNNVSITLHNGSNDYQDFYGDYPTWSVTSGDVYWVAFG